MNGGHYGAGRIISRGSTNDMCRLTVDIRSTVPAKDLCDEGSELSPVSFEILIWTIGNAGIAVADPDVLSLAGHNQVLIIQIAERVALAMNLADCVSEGRGKSHSAAVRHFSLHSAKPPVEPVSLKAFEDVVEQAVIVGQNQCPMW
jgi:hypothetical protein